MSGHSASDVDARWMSLALTLGRRGLGRVWPNPAVGCVIVKDDRVVGRGWTQDGGRPHAEVVALAQAGSEARGADVYVTLEPCAHTGQTPPCAQALIDAGVRRVVMALEDPDERVSGRGAAMLRDAGIVAEVGVLSKEAAIANAGFLNRVSLGRPMVTLKLAMSLDGRIATASGESQWITGPEARRAVHAMRACHDAVLVGAGTARTDLPSLTVRGLGVDRQPTRVVISRGLDLPMSGPLFETAKEVPVIIIHGPGADQNLISVWEAAGAKLREIGAGMRVEDALSALAAEGMTRIFCEGGGFLASSLLAANVVDRLVVMQAGLVLGADGLAGVADMGHDLLSAITRFELLEHKSIGGDSLQVWHRR